MTLPQREGGDPVPNRPDWPSNQPHNVFLPPVSAAYSLDQDPAGFMADALERAKWWLRGQGDLVQVHEALKIATVYWQAVKKRKFSASVILDAEELRRRTEYRVGTLILDGQAAGIFNTPNKTNALSLIEVLGVRSHNEVTKLRSYGHFSPQDFEAAIELGRAEGNLSLAHIRRIHQGEELVSTRSEWNVGKRRIDSTRIMESLRDELEVAMTGIDLIVPSELDPEYKKECRDSIRTSLRRIMKEVSKW